MNRKYDQENLTLKKKKDDEKSFCLSGKIKLEIKYTHVLGNMRKCPVGD